MPRVYEKIIYKGQKGEIEVNTLINSGADLTILTQEIVEKIDPEYIGECDVETADGRWSTAKLYKVGIKIYILNRKIRKTIGEAILLTRKSYSILGVETMEKLHIIPDVETGRVILKNNR
ncbi:MAG: hypothetical protein QMD71_07675 [bacterium]|nr:hypothetical protein [bacterium]